MQVPRLGTVILAAVVIAGCGGMEQSAGQATGYTAGAVAKQANPVAAPNLEAPGPRLGGDGGAGVAVAPEVTPRTSPPSMLNPSPAPGCPMVVANPVGCPLPSARPLVPPTGRARISLCPPASGVLLPGGSLAVCGAGFMPGESVVVMVVGRVGSLTVPARAAPDGTLRVVLPSSACRVAPWSITVRGSRGSVSNTIPVPPLACRSY